MTKLADPDLWLVRDCVCDGAGKEIHMFWEAASFQSNTFPGQATFDRLDRRFYQHFYRSFPSDGAIEGVPDRVVLRVRLQPIGLDTAKRRPRSGSSSFRPSLDDLVASGDVDPAFRAAMPTFDIGQGASLEWTAESATETYTESRLPFRCVTNSSLDVTLPTRSPRCGTRRAGSGGCATHG